MSIIEKSDRYIIGGDRYILKNNSRDLAISKSDLVEIGEERTINISVSSDQPYDRGYFYEVLHHTDSAIDLGRMNDGAMALYNHRRDDYVGVIERAWIESGRLYNTIRFDDHELAEKIVRSIQKGIMRNVSIGYAINDINVIDEKSDKPTLEAIRWTPFESSFVTVPADASVGVGRQYFDLSQSNDSSISPEVSENEGVRELSTVEEDITTPIMVDNNTETDIKNERALERARIQNILAAGKRFNCAERAEEAVESGMSEQDFFRSILSKQGVEEQTPVAAVAPIGMSKEERNEYSVLRAVGYAAGHLSADECGLELDVSRAIAKRDGRSTKGIFIDQSELVAYRAPYETGVPEAAGNLIETELLSERFIEQLYNESAFLPMGVTYLRDLTGNVEIPRESSYTTGYWVGEKQTIPEDEGTFDKISMSPKKLAARTKMTFEMTEQASIDLERLARQRLLRGLALELDRTIGFGSGVGSEPLGIVSHPETKSIVLGANGGALDWAALIAMQSELFANNVMGNLGYVMNARTKAKLQTTLDQSTGSGSWIWQTTAQGDGTIAGYRARCSNQIPNNLSKGTANNLTAIFFGDFSQVLLGLWSGMEILADPYSEFNEAIIQVRAMQLVDLQLTRGDYFCVATDVQNN